jgi:hypothetical protein
MNAFNSNEPQMTIYIYIPLFSIYIGNCVVTVGLGKSIYIVAKRTTLG